MPDARAARDRMVETQIARRGVRDKRVLAAMREVPREAFVEEGFEEFAFEDSPLPIGDSQTISQPYIVALMLEAAEFKATDRVLDVGTGSGYAAAVAARLAARVFTIERHARLAETACARFTQLGIANVEVRTGDGTLGWPEAAPFDAILVAAGGPIVPDALKRQLSVGGRLVIPVGGEERRQELLKITSTGEASYEKENFGPVFFVPLIGAGGWAGEADDEAAPQTSPAGSSSRR